MMHFSENFVTDRQAAFAYAIYMMVASCFHTAKCANSISETWMHLNYVQQKDKAKADMEDMAAAYADRFFAKVIPGQLFREDVRVKFLKNSGHYAGMAIIGSDFTMEFQSELRNGSCAFVSLRCIYKGEEDILDARILIHGQNKAIKIRGGFRMDEPLGKKPEMIKTNAQITERKHSEMREKRARSLLAESVALSEEVAEFAMGVRLAKLAG